PEPAPPFGFGPSEASWLPQPEEWAELTVERQASDPGSMLTLYRGALALRRRAPPRGGGAQGRAAALPSGRVHVRRCRPPLGDGQLAWIEAGQALLAFRREPGFLC